MTLEELRNLCELTVRNISNDLRNHHITSKEASKRADTAMIGALLFEGGLQNRRLELEGVKNE